MTPRPFHGHLHAFRAFAIVSIVAIHAVSLWLWILSEGGTREPTLEIIGRVNEVLLHDSTIYFALISGLLYSLVLHGRGLGSFYLGKAGNVLLPYVLLSLLFSCLDWAPQRGWFLGPPEGVSLLQLIGQNLLTGQALFVFWYIPVVLTLFLVTPGLYRLLMGPHGWGWLLICLALPAVFTRTGVEFSGSSVLYFMAPYALGLWLGQDYEVRLAWVKRARWPLLAVVLGSAPALYWGLDLDGAEPAAFFNAVETLFYVQKTALALLVLMALRRFDAGVSRGVGLLAESAFAIYFLHAAILLEAAPWLKKLVPAGAAWPYQLGLMVLLLIFSVMASLLITRALQALLGRRSRYVVGA